MNVKSELLFVILYGSFNFKRLIKAVGRQIIKVMVF